MLLLLKMETRRKRNRTKSEEKEIRTVKEVYELIKLRKMYSTLKPDNYKQAMKNIDKIIERRAES